MAGAARWCQRRFRLHWRCRRTRRWSAPSIGAAGPTMSQSGATGARGAGRGASVRRTGTALVDTETVAGTAWAMAARTVASCTVAAAEAATSSNSMPAMACDKVLATFVLL